MTLPTAPPSAHQGIVLTKDESAWAMAAHALTFIEGGIIGPLVIYMVKKDTSPFIAFHALQSFYFGLVFLVVTLVTCGVGGLLLIVPYFVFELIALREANAGRWYRLPLVGGWAWEKHPGPSSSGELPTGL